MNSVETQGRNLQEALLKASQQLQAPVDSLGYELLERKGGLLGILGGKRVRLRAWRKRSEMEEARLFLEGLLSRAGLECRVARVKAEEQVLALELEGEDSRLLLRKEGELLDALAYLTERNLGKKTAKHKKVLVDAEGFRALREQQLREKALEAAQKAMRNGSAALGPLSARDRRTVHLFLKGKPGLASRSIGQGPLRKVLITRQSLPGLFGDEGTPP